MGNNEFYKKVISIKSPDSGFLAYKSEQSDCYFGKDDKNNVVFIINSEQNNNNSSFQETNSLIFIFNKKCSFVLDNELIERKVHILICKSDDLNKVEAFIRLSRAFSFNMDNEQYNFSNLFTALVSLFDKEKSFNEIEIQGFFAELYFINYLYKIGCNILDFWQTKNKMKFDFSFENNRRLEIKSTIKTIRTHHFKHDQLYNQFYDIKVVSIMLQKNDKGLSILDIANDLRNNCPNNYYFHLYIESYLSHFDQKSLEDIRYDEKYINRNLKIFEAKDIPHFDQVTPIGIYNTEYDSILENLEDISIMDFINWLKEKHNV